MAEDEILVSRGGGERLSDDFAEVVDRVSIAPLPAQGGQLVELAVAEDDAAIISVAERSVADNLARGVDLERLAPATKISEI